MRKIILASHNKGKIAELRNALKPLGIEPVSAADLNLPEPEETGESFHENALIKAKAAAMASGLPALADDSGLAVAALDGRPGIYSARWAPKDSNGTQDFTKAMQKIEDELTQIKSSPVDRAASFICVLAYYIPNDQAPKQHYFEGRVDGQIISPPRGENGFGYDPCFEANELPGKTFAEISQDTKKSFSHRGRAVRKFLDFVKNYPD